MQKLIFIFLYFVNFLFLDLFLLIFLPTDYYFMVVSITMFVAFLVLYFSAHIVLISLGARHAQEHDHIHFYTHLKNQCFFYGLDVPEIYFYSSSSEKINKWLSSLSYDFVLINRNTLNAANDYEREKVLDKLIQEKMNDRTWLKTSVDSLLILFLHLISFFSNLVSFRNNNIRNAVFFAGLLFFIPFFFSYYLILMDSNKLKDQLNIFARLKYFANKQSEKVDDPKVLLLDAILVEEI
ncbi:hypothetical protein N9N67_00055 [Bacteriovoracaceae bacterium]|nr:hypothetical protein [Bacteriovoracaceae bacterium]